MPQKKSEQRSSGSSGSGRLREDPPIADFVLPEIGQADELVEHSEPTFAQQLAHARKLLAWRGGREPERETQTERFKM